MKAGDTVELLMPKTSARRRSPIIPNRFAVMWDRLVLAGDWGRALSFEQARGPRPEVPVLVAPEQPWRTG